MKKLLFTICIILAVACEKDPEPPASLPVVVTDELVTAITQASAVCKGEVLDDYRSPVTERGIYWSESPSTPYLGNKTEAGSGKGIFSVTLTGLRRNRLYNIRAYAINNAGIAYGKIIAFRTPN
jgi:hypothetical protein